MLNGGAAIAAQRLHKKLNHKGIESRFLYKTGLTSDPTYIKWEWQKRDFFSRRKRRFLHGLEKKYKQRYIPEDAKEFEQFNLSMQAEGVRLKDIDYVPDIINLHWIGGMFNYGHFFSSIPMHIPIVWTLHDMNAFTGGCHYAGTCNKYLDHCGSCPQLHASSAHDLSYKVFKDKYRWYRQSFNKRVCIVSPSNWLKKVAESSQLLNGHDIQCIPNGLDTNKFKPHDKNIARDVLGIPRDAQVLLFVADNIENTRKGIDLLNGALNRLKNRHNLFLLTIGRGESRLEFSGKHIHVGYIEMEEIMSMVYSAADLFIAPSREDNLPNTLLESISCGTPVIAFDQGGMRDVVREHKTGFLVKDLTASALGDAIENVLNNPQLIDSLHISCREVAGKEYSNEVQANRYIELYNSLL